MYTFAMDGNMNERLAGKSISEMTYFASHET